MQNRPVRSVLYMPASNERALAKAETLPADALILDLEDATAVSQKDNARALLKAKLKKKPYGQKLVIIRVNSRCSDWYDDDLRMAVAAKADVILVPKVDNASDVSDILRDIDALNASKKMQLWVMIETPMALINLYEIAALGPVSRLGGLVLGTNDLAKEMNIPLPSAERPDRIGFLTYFSNCILAARAYGLVVLDGVFNDFNDAAGLEFEALQAKQLGFDGKTLIHPKQIDKVNDVFAASAEELAMAQKIIDAFALPENADLGAITIDGKMIERLHVDMAKAMLEKAKYYG
ncbi:MAG: CoA ester lyase [Hyphomicrobiales bacterium]|nr:MAG: CoA ester lyase [Hyphomicrobiales bacterium]